MKSIYFSAFFSLLLLAPSSANAAGAMLRIVCDDAAAGAEVYLNGKLKGECPLDMKVPEGTLKLRVVKDTDAEHEPRRFEKELIMGEDVMKKVEVQFGPIELNAAGKRREEEAARALLESIASNMVAIPAGSFEMGSDNDFNEKPVHTVTIRQPFAIGKYEVTQAEWQAVMGDNPSTFKNCGGNCPVETVSWDDAQEFIRRLNQKTGKNYRLPTEAEREYACRAGGQQQYCGGDNPDAVGWYNGNSGSATHPVAQKQANAFGLHDMNGNVWEWVQDSYHYSYNGAPSDGGVWQGDGAKRVLRGGSWSDEPKFERAAFRNGVEPAFRSRNLGFRLARTLP